MPTLQVEAAIHIGGSANDRGLPGCPEHFICTWGREKPGRLRSSTFCAIMTTRLWFIRRSVSGGMDRIMDWCSGFSESTVRERGQKRTLVHFSVLSRKKWKRTTKIFLSAPKPFGQE